MQELIGVMNRTCLIRAANGGHGSVCARDDEEIVYYGRGAKRYHHGDVEEVLAAPKQCHDDKRQTEFRDQPPDTEPCLSHLHERVRLAESKIQNPIRGYEVSASEYQYCEHQQSLNPIHFSLSVPNVGMVKTKLIMQIR
ncbi:hypothetical protein ABIF31_008474 [Bradyrhizobium elkanii]